MRSLPLVTITLAVLLTACAAAPVHTVASAPQSVGPPIPGLDARQFGEPVPVPPVASLFNLTKEQEADFLQYFHDPRRAAEAPHRRLFAYLDQRLKGFRYYGPTQSAADALSAHEGNCLTLALLTTALARLAEVEVAYQRISDTPVFERSGNVVLVSEHVRSLLFDPGYTPEPGVRVLQRPYIIIDYFPDRRRRAGGRVSEATLQSMYYSNLAGEAMAERRNRDAYWLVRAALEQDPGNVGALNSLAVLHRRTGREDIAEALYVYALQRHGDSLTLLSNYRTLLQTQGRESQAADLERRLMLLPVGNPYDLVELGNYAFLQGRHQQALAFYEKVLQHAPYLHEALWRQAVVYEALGRPKKAGELLMAAQAAAGRAQDRRLYQAKALSLQGH